jgi:hypothetical protein
VTNNLFDISNRDGIISTHPYDSLPVRIEVPVSGNNYEFLKVSDNDNPDCSAAEEFMVNCDSLHCNIYDLSFSNIECPTDSTYIVSIDFGYEDVINTSFDLYDRDSLVGLFDYSELPIRLELQTSGHNYEYLKVSDNDNADCSDEGEFEVECFTNSAIPAWAGKLKLSPNPAKDFIIVDGLEKLDYVIISTIGQIITEGRINPNERISLSDLQAGMYIIQFRRNGEQYLKSFIKQ